MLILGFCLQSKGVSGIKQWIGSFVEAFGSDWRFCDLLRNNLHQIHIRRIPHFPFEQPDKMLVVLVPQPIGNLADGLVGEYK